MRGTLPSTGSKDSKDSSTLLKTLDEERGEVPPLRPRLLSRSDISSDSDSDQGGKPLLRRKKRVIDWWQCHVKDVLLRHGVQERRRARKWDKQLSWLTMSDLYLTKCAITLCHVTYLC